MRFGSKSAKYEICYKRDVIQTYGIGETQVLQPLWNCRFSPNGITSDEVAQINTWAINRGMPKEEDQVTAVAPESISRYGVFDTEEFQQLHRDDIFERTPNGFDDAERLKLEEFLLAHQDEWYRVIETPVLAPPWPSYDKFRGVKGTPTAERIAEKVREDGYDPAGVLAYERATANRQDVVDALEALLAPAEDETLISA